ncbi:MAG: carbohydrate ABC transporter permease, partial [Chloroflexales bacterium]
MSSEQARSAARAAVQPAPKRATRHRLRAQLERMGLHALLGLTVLVMSAPLAWMLLSSLKPDQENAAYPPSILPHTWTLQNYRLLFTLSDFGTYLRNSCIVAGVVTVLTIVIGVNAAYALSRFRFRWLNVLAGVALFAYTIPPILLLVPIARTITSLKMGNSLPALILIDTATLLPFALWVLRSYFNGLVIEIEQAAMIDGCTRFGAFVRVALPQAVPGIISTSIFTFNAAWSEYLFAATLTVSPSKLTLSPGMALLLDQTGVYSWGLLMAGAVVMTLPVLVLFTIIQRRLVN